MPVPAPHSLACSVHSPGDSPELLEFVSGGSRFPAQSSWPQTKQRAGSSRATRLLKGGYFVW